MKANKVERVLRSALLIRRRSRICLASFSEKPIHLSIFLLSVLCLTNAFAQNVQRIETREVRKREAIEPRGQEALAAGKVAMSEKNFTLAHEQFRAAVTYLPGTGHDEAVSGFCDSGVKLAE